MFKILILCIFFIVGNSMSSFVFKPVQQNQGVGAKVIRVIGNQKLKRLDPFLMLDYFNVKLPAGFPDHPHRGFETVTYMIKGAFYHQDFKGNKGKIGPGDLQWMTAGRGILHSEMPASKDEESIGFQLWINLKSQLKMVQPAYQQYTADKLPITKKDDAQVKVISGKWEGVKGPIQDRTPAYYLDVKLNSKGKFKISIPNKWNAIIFVFEGQAIYNQKTEVPLNYCCYLEHSDDKQTEHLITSENGARFLLIGGEPINQPIAQHGPFVMNTQKQIQETFNDYKYQKNGFQGASNWQSKIQDMAKGKQFQQL